MVRLLFRRGPTPKGGLHRWGRDGAGGESYDGVEFAGIHTSELAQEIFPDPGQGREPPSFSSTVGQLEGISSQLVEYVHLPQEDCLEVIGSFNDVT